MMLTFPEPWRTHPLATLSPAALQWRIAQLVRRYRQSPEPALARDIGDQLRLLCLHPDFQADREVRCHYRHLALYWNRLGQNGKGAV